MCFRLPINRKDSHGSVTARVWLRDRKETLENTIRVMQSSAIKPIVVDELRETCAGDVVSVAFDFEQYFISLLARQLRGYLFRF